MGENEITCDDRNAGAALLDAFTNQHRYSIVKLLAECALFTRKITIFWKRNDIL